MAKAELGQRILAGLDWVATAINPYAEILDSKTNGTREVVHFRGIVGENEAGVRKPNGNAIITTKQSVVHDFDSNKELTARYRMNKPPITKGYSTLTPEEIRRIKNH